jgi:hypothetical protein
MENKKMSKEQMRNYVQPLVKGAKFACMVAEVEELGGKNEVLDALMEELKKLDHRGACCGESKGNAACNNATCEETPMPSGVTFGTALAYLKRGCKVARKGWNGKGQYVELAECISYRNRAAKIVNAAHQAIGNAALAFVGTSGVQLGWLASQADMLAEDWYVVE